MAVLNTCGFIESAKSEAIDNILELARLKDAGKLKKLLVAGCLSQRYPEDIRTELPEVDGMLGTGSYTDVVSAVEELMAGEALPEHFGDIHHTDEDGARIVTTPPYTAYLKIAEGCSNGCAFCIIPKLRGRYRSRSMESLLRGSPRTGRPWGEGADRHRPRISLATVWTWGTGPPSPHCCGSCASCPSTGSGCTTSIRRR